MPAALSQSGSSGAGNQLRRLLRNEIALEVAFDEPIYDIDGRVLLPAGKKLTEQDVQMLQRRGGYLRQESPASPDDVPAANEPAPRLRLAGAAATDEPPTAAPEQVMAELSRQHHGGSTKGHEKRKHQRKQWHTVIRLVLEDPKLVGNRRAIEVTTQDISVGGFAFIHSQYLYPGTIVRACFNNLPNQPWLKGIIRDCRLLGGIQHRIGVQFTEIVKNRA